MLAYYRSIAEATRLGMLIYSRDWANFSEAMVERLSSIPNLVAWKDDGQGDIRRLQAIMNRLGDHLYWIGGAPVMTWYRLTSHHAELEQLMHGCVIPLYAMRARRRGYEVSTMKALMDLAGLRVGPVRLPLVEVSDLEKEELRDILDNWKQFLD